MPGVGRVAPSFRLADQRGRRRSLAELLGEDEGGEGHHVLLLFYPRSFDPASTAQLRYFEEKLEELAGAGVAFVAIGPQSPEDHERLHGFLNLSFELLSDEGGQVARAYGLGEGESEADAHAVFLVHPGGTITFLDRDFRLRPPEDFRRLLRAIQLQAGGASASGRRPGASGSR